MAKTSKIQMAESMRRLSHKMANETDEWVEIDKLREAVASEMPVAPGPQYTKEFLVSNGFVVDGEKFCKVRPC